MIQENQAITDFQGYITKLEGWGFSIENPKPLIFAMAIYHQSPASANRVVQTAGGTATLDRIYQVCMNDSVLGRYRNRYTTVYNRLNAWDGESMPPDFGQIGVTVDGGDSGGISQNAAQVKYIQQIGDNLILYGASFPNGLMFYKAFGEIWTPAKFTGGDSITGGNTGGGVSTDVVLVQ